MFEGAKCRPEYRQCRAKDITRLQYPWYAGILPPYAAPLLGRSLSGSQLSRKRASSLPPFPLLGTASPSLYLAAIPPHLRRGKPRRKCSGRPGSSRSGCRRRQCRSKSATDCAGRSVQGSIRCRERRTPIGQVSRSGSGRGGRLPSHIVGLFRCSREPEVSLPRRSRARQPHTARPPPRPRSTSLRALGHWETLRRASASRSVLTPTASSAPPSRPRDSQQPRPTRGTTPRPQC